MEGVGDGVHVNITPEMESSILERSSQRQQEEDQIVPDNRRRAQVFHQSADPDKDFDDAQDGSSLQQ